MKTRYFLALGAALLSWAGCTGTQAEPPAPEARPVLTEPRPVRAEKATKQLGEDCTDNGASACLSGVCLHVKPGRNEGYVCSQACQSAAQCPQGWRCTRVYPTPEGMLCTPSAR